MARVGLGGRGVWRGWLGGWGRLMGVEGEFFFYLLG